jgi:hypothetical protein
MGGELTKLLAARLSKLTPAKIESMAHACEHWVRLKADLRNCTTKHKLAWLRMYLDTEDTVLDCCSDEMREIQARHYLYQMHRSGLIDLLPKDFSFADRLNWVKEVTIRDDWTDV